MHEACADDVERFEQCIITRTYITKPGVLTKRDEKAVSINVFRRGDAPQVPVSAPSMLLERHFANTSAPQAGLEAAAVELLDALGGPPRTGVHLRDSLGWSDEEMVRQLGLLCASGHVSPAEQQLFSPEIDDLMTASVDQVQVLSPSGIEFAFSRVDRAIWRARGPGDVIARALAFLLAEGHRLPGPDDAAAQRAAMRHELGMFRESVPHLVRAGWPVHEGLWGEDAAQTE